MSHAAAWAAAWGIYPEALAALAEGEAAARVTAEFRGGYLVVAEAGELKAGSSGKLRRDIKKHGAAKPAVGDWVAVTADAQGGTAVIHRVLPRRTVMVRRAAGRDVLPQVVAANVDVVLIATALAGDLSPRRLERYLAVVRESGARAAILLTKPDLCDDLDAALAEVRAVAAEAPVHVVSPLTGAGLDALEPYFAGDATVALVGSSGVGKSTLINRLLGGERLATGVVRDDGRGRHTTSHRELLPRATGGGLVMDTPGMREIGLWEAEEGLADTFADVTEVAAGCRFRDCRHAGEPGCAVAEALAEGRLDPARVDAWRKLVAEMSEDRSEAARKRNAKVLSRMVKDVVRKKYE